MDGDCGVLALTHKEFAMRWLSYAAGAIAVLSFAPTSSSLHSMTA